ncbi:hypothetical protein FC40_GL000254 [Ligilactobacillus hayakitensis DSM 18933 = JCM 14209]|uniref:Transposase n=1 Tax=Ligilactobacillus hayakitensis DSM 18933 = JCM 14209 TaxID=1423755 RepID=A0A0R1WNK7_9LACO|nr:hypothetical protein [Ligilactobacillus hayakitensis]KRM19327.1 hypothetical protein FC40_GL000254 [Ligilactobacillus hayakitensis DSM 18933 = JCM 14209]
MNKDEAIKFFMENKDKLDINEISEKVGVGVETLEKWNQDFIKNDKVDDILGMVKGALKFGK